MDLSIFPSMFPRKLGETLIVLLIIISSSTTLITGAAIEDSSPPMIEGFSENSLLSTSDSIFPHHSEPSIVISDNGTLMAVWKDGLDHWTDGERIMFSKSADGGCTWTNPSRLPAFQGLETKQTDARLEWYENTLYCCYVEFNWLDPIYCSYINTSWSVSSRPYNLSQITLSKSNDYGLTWQSTCASISPQNNMTCFVDKPTMSFASDGTIYIVYEELHIPFHHTTMRLMRSIDGGLAFTNISIVGRPDSWPWAPYVECSPQDDIYVTYQYRYGYEGAVVGALSQDDGETFSSLQLVSFQGNNSYVQWGRDTNGQRCVVAKATMPVARFDQTGRLYVVWSDMYNPDDGTWDVYLSYSDDSGTTWSERIQINPRVDGDQWKPEMAIDSQNRIHIVYYNEQDRGIRPYYRMVIMEGDDRDMPNLGVPVQISNESTSYWYYRGGDYFSVTIDSDDVPHIVWTDGRNDELDIMYAKGVPWSSQTNANGFNLGAQEILLLGILSAAAIIVLVVIIDMRRSR